MQPDTNISKCKTSLQNTKFILRSLINSNNRQMTALDLSRDYRKAEGVPIPFVQLGYRRLEDFLQSLTDTLICHHMRDGSMSVSAIQSRNSKHISDLVREQKPPKCVRTGRSNARADTTPFPVWSQQQTNNYNYQSTQQRPAYQHSRHPDDKPPPLLQYRSSDNSQHPVPSPKMPLLHLLASNATDVSHRQTQQNVQRPKLPTAVRANISSYESGLVDRKQPLQERHTAVNKQSIVISSDDGGCAVLKPQTTPSSTSDVGPVATSVRNALARHRPRPTDLLHSSSDEEFDVRTRQPRSRTAAVPIATATQINRQFTCCPSGNSSTTQTTTKRLAAAPQSAAGSTPSTSSDDHVICVTAPAPSKEPTVPSLLTVLEQWHINDRSDALGDAALPQLSDIDPIFMSDLPDNVAKYDTTVAPARLPDGMAANSRLQLYVTEVNSPTKFWFHVQDEHSRLDVLMFQLDNYYNHPNNCRLQMREYNAIPGQLCVAMFENVWHRAIIVERIKNDKTIKVHLFDYGTTAPVPLLEIRYILVDFAQLPVQAHRGSLHGVQPAGLKWCRAATNAFLGYVAQVMLYGRITHVDPDTAVVRMELVNTTHGETDVIIHERLLLRQFARPFNYLSTNGEPIAHHSELYPTFQMLETGSYPSFSEIGMYIAQGIDYEAIYDENLPPKYRNSPAVECKKVHPQRRFHHTNPFAAGLDDDDIEANKDMVTKTSKMKKLLEQWKAM